jgi:nicotinamide-nucleotide amidase
MQSLIMTNFVSKVTRIVLAEIIAIGDELLIGQTIDTNSGWIAEQLNLLGIHVRQIRDISDDRDLIYAAIDESLSKADLVIMTGGLGPTRDDITKEVLCDYFNTDLVLNENILLEITRFFDDVGLKMLEVNKQQADLPRACEILPNARGTASGMWFEKEGKIVISMPGVPYEMKGIMLDHGLARISEYFHTPTIVHHTIHTQGIGESFLAEKVESWEDKLELNDVSVAYLPSPGMVRVRISARGDDELALKSKVAAYAEEFEKLVPQYVYGINGESLEKKVGEALIKSGQTLSTAESCTGGNIAHLITTVAGSSEYFKGSVVSYDNSVKISILGVEEKDIQMDGAVSKSVVEQMAVGVRDNLKTDWAIATSGVAGPGGGTEEKPVGTVWIAIASPSGVKSRRFKFGRNRSRNITMTSLSALNWLRIELLSA